jgi:hypothetical protein
MWLRFLGVIATIFLLQVVPVNSYAYMYAGSEYQLVVAPDITWEMAQAAAQASGWHLAAITSPEENAAVYNNLVVPEGPVGGIDAYSAHSEPLIRSIPNPLYHIAKLDSKIIRLAFDLSQVCLCLSH